MGDQKSRRLSRETKKQNRKNITFLIFFEKPDLITLWQKIWNVFEFTERQNDNDIKKFGHTKCF